jgi:Flp pilus assembly protein TadG
MNRARQKGIAAVFVVVALLALVGVAGVALDASHVVRNKARLQSAVDATALSAAKVLDQTGDTADATAAANATFGTNAAAFPELSTAVAAGLTPVIEYSNTLIPFAPGTAPAMYVRVRLENFRTEASLSTVLGLTEMPARASAVAGPSPSVGQACNIVPMVVCGDPMAPAPYYGYQPGQIEVLKIGSGAAGGDIGPGNFQLIRLGGSGANIVRQNLAGGYEGCVVDGSTVETQPGNVAGPVAQGLNTRFNLYSGGGMNSTDYPPDVVTREPSPRLNYSDATQTVTQGGAVVTTASEINYNYGSYAADIAANRFNVQPAPGGIGAFLRREMAITIADCSGINTGQSTLPVLGFGCFFLLQRVEQSGIDSYAYGQFLENCESGGRPGPAPDNSPGPYIIQLYDDQASGDS